MVRNWVGDHVIVLGRFGDGAVASDGTVPGLGWPVTVRGRVGVQGRVGG